MTWRADSYQHILNKGGVRFILCVCMHVCDVCVCVSACDMCICVSVCVMCVWGTCVYVCMYVYMVYYVCREEVDVGFLFTVFHLKFWDGFSH